MDDSTTTYTISGMELSDGTKFNVTALTYVGVNSSGNLEISSPTGAKINLKSSDNIQVKPNDKIQLATENYSDTDKQDEFRIAVIKADRDTVEGMKIETAGIKFETAAADTDYWNPDLFKILYKKQSGDTDTWTNVNMHAASFDVRTRATAAGTGGGIALQVASCDNNCHENKLKIETSRKFAPNSGKNGHTLPQSTSEWSEYYLGEGGKGVEIGTFNSQFESFDTVEFRRNKDTTIWATTRSPVVLNDGKYDFQTQSDDSKDCKSTAQSSVTWLDIVNTALFLKKNGSIPTDGRLLDCWKVTTNYTNVSANNYEFAIHKDAAGTAASADFSVTVGALGGYTLGSVTYTVGDGAAQTATAGIVAIAAASLTGDVVITATAS